HVMDFKTGRIRAITKNTPKEFSNHDPVWSHDGRRLAFTRQRADEKADVLFVVDLRGGAPQRVSPEGSEHNYHAADWSPDGRRLLITSNALNRFYNIALLDLKSGAIDWITQETWECYAAEFRGRFIAYESNIDGNTRIFLYDVKTRKRKPLGTTSGLNSFGSEVFSPDGKR